MIRGAGRLTSPASLDRVQDGRHLLEQEDDPAWREATRHSAAFFGNQIRRLPLSEAEYERSRRAYVLGRLDTSKGMA